MSSFETSKSNLPQSETLIHGSKANNINLLRFIAASVVIYYHMDFLLGKPIYTIMGQGLGALAVNVFFILSGYLIASSWTHSSSFMSYLIRRMSRIFPALIVVVLFSLLIIGPIFTSLTINEYFANPETWKYLMVIFLFPTNSLPGVFENLPYPSAINGSLWTLRYEFAMYLLVPLAYSFLGLFGQARKAATIGSLLLLVFGYFITSNGFVCAPELLVVSLRLATYFFTGCTVYEFSLTNYTDAQYSIIAILFVLIFAREEGAFWSLILIFATAVFVFGFSFAPEPRFSKCFSKNDFSYGIYIWAFPVQQILVQLGKGSSQDSTLLYSVVAFVITLIFAIGSWFLVEKPCIALGKKLSKHY